MSLSLTESKLITVKDVEEHVEQPTSYPNPVSGASEGHSTRAGRLLDHAGGSAASRFLPTLHPSQSFQQDIPLGEKSTALII